MSSITLTDVARASEEWRSFSSPADVRDFFIRLSKTLIHLWKEEAFNAFEKQLRELADFADTVPKLSSDEVIRSYSRGAIDILLDQCTELMNASSTTAERLISGEVPAPLGKNQLRVVDYLYDRPARPVEIADETNLDSSYVSRLLKELETAEIVRRAGPNYALTSAGIRAYAKLVEPGWAHKARRYLLLMVERLDTVGTFSRCDLAKAVALDLNISPDVADRLVSRTLEELKAKGRLSIEDDRVLVQPTAFAVLETFRSLQ